MGTRKSESDGWKVPGRSVVIRILTAVCMITFLNASGQGQPILFRGYVLDASDNTPLPFANVFNTARGTGTATNPDGYFELPGNLSGEPLQVSYLGYATQALITSRTLPDTIRLEPISQRVNEIVVEEKGLNLYGLIPQLAKHRTAPTREAKTYFYLETQLDKETVEVIESYHNGRYRDCGVDTLLLKKGRIGLLPVRHRYFMSTETSRVFSLHDIFEPSPLFPDNPLCLTKNVLKNKYQLTLVDTYQEDGALRYVIEFAPKQYDREYFSGTLWIDPVAKHVLKIKLNIQNSMFHPFVAIGNYDIGRVDMEITRTFALIDGLPYVSQIDLNYSVQCAVRTGGRYRIETTSFITAYDYAQTFDLPHFKFSENQHKDYRDMTAVPYDTAFWSMVHEFRLFERTARVAEFILGQPLGQNFSLLKNDQELTQFQYAYLNWSPKRFFIRSRINYVDDAISTLSRDNYHLNTQLYLDVNQIGDSLICQSAAILDPVNTYFSENMTNRDLAFVNISFDLLEIHRRAMLRQLRERHLISADEVRALYGQTLEAFNADITALTRETKSGEDLFALRKWNAQVFDALGIDNLALFPDDKQ